MALMTSSSVTSSAVPAKEVSRRSIRMARSLSALLRRALISWRRSVSLRGRKSMETSPSQIEKTLPRMGNRNPRVSGPGRQLGEQEVDAAVHQVVVMLDFQHLAAGCQVEAYPLGPHHHTDGRAALGQG